METLLPFVSHIASSGFVRFNCVVPEDRSQTLRFERYLVPARAGRFLKSTINS